MGMFSKTPVKISAADKQRYNNEDTAALEKEAQTLRNEQVHPELTVGQKAGSIASGLSMSPESALGQIGGSIAGSRLIEGAKGPWIGAGVGTLAGINAVHRYNNAKRTHKAEEAGVRLDFVEHLITERTAKADAAKAGETTGRG